MLIIAHIRSEITDGGGLGTSGTAKCATSSLSATHHTVNQIKPSTVAKILCCV